MSQPSPVVAASTLDRTKYQWEVNRTQKPKTKATIRALLLKEDGNNCQICGGSLGDWATDSTANIPDIDHIDDDNANWHRENLRLAHSSCNSALFQQRRVMKAVAAIRQTKEKENQGATTTDPLPSPSQPITRTLNLIYKPRFMRYIIDVVLAIGREPKTPNDVLCLYPENVQKAAVLFTGCDPQTGYRYLSPHINPINGLFVISPVDHKAGPDTLQFRNADFYDKTADEILNLFPIQGLWSRAPFREATEA